MARTVEQKLHCSTVPPHACLKGRRVPFFRQALYGPNLMPRCCGCAGCLLLPERRFFPRRRFPHPLLRRFVGRCEPNAGCDNAQ